MVDLNISNLHISGDNDHCETVIEERVDDSGRRFRVHRKIVKRLVTHKVSPAIATRRKWKKFGDAEGHEEGPNTKTTMVGEDVFLKFSSNKAFELDDNMDPLMKSDKMRAISCRHCQGPHWTSKCPYKDMLPLLEIEKNEQASSAGGMSSADIRSTGSAGGSDMGSGGSKYVPPSLRNKTVVDGSNLDNKEDAMMTVRVTNLSDDTTELDLKKLFSFVGTVSRLYMAKDHATGLCKGFAFVTYTTKESALKAVAKLNRHPWNNLILKVEMAKPQ